MKKTSKFVPACIPPSKTVIIDKYNKTLSVSDYSDIDVRCIGHMVATPIQFYASFFERTDYCIQYVVKGEGDYFVNNQVYKLKKHTLFLLPQRKYHYYTANKDNPYEYLWIHFSGKGFQNFMAQIGLSEDNPVLFDLINPNIEKVFHELIELSKRQESNKYLILGKGYQLLHEINTCCVNINQQNRKNNPRIDNVIEYINKHYQENLTLESLSAKFFMNKYYFVKLFKKYTNLTPIQYLIQYRVSIAMTMLRTTNISITEISEQCGFHSPTNFLLRFKELIGCSPSDYRKNTSGVITTRESLSK